MCRCNVILRQMAAHVQKSMVIVSRDPLLTLKLFCDWSKAWLLTTDGASCTNEHGYCATCSIVCIGTFMHWNCSVILAENHGWSMMIFLPFNYIIVKAYCTITHILNYILTLTLLCKVRYPYRRHAVSLIYIFLLLMC